MLDRTNELLNIAKKTFLNAEDVYLYVGPWPHSDQTVNVPTLLAWLEAWYLVPFVVNGNVVEPATIEDDDDEEDDDD